MPLDRIKDIFAPIFPAERDPSPAAAYATALAGACGAHMMLRAISIEAWAPYSPISSVPAGYVAAENAAARAKMADVASHAQSSQAAGPSQLDSGSFVGPHASILELVTQQGRLHDLSVVDRSMAALAEASAAINALLFESGRPVIVVPPTIASFKAARIVVAWDGSRQAVRALNDAMPFLEAAEHVDIVCVSNEKELATSAPGAEIAPHLARHGVRTEVSDLTPPDRSAARAIRDHAQLIAADMIVMGAFVHSRISQLVMGGVTDSMLANSELPLFMSY